MNISEITLVQTRLNSLINQPLTRVGRAVDMLTLEFAGRYALHIQCYYRLDEAIERLNSDLDGLTVKTAMLNQLGDLTMVFACGATLTVMADTSGGEECWRLFEDDEAAEHLVVYADGAELQ